MLRLTGDHNDDDYYEDDVGVDKTSCFPSAYTSFCLVSGTLGTKKKQNSVCNYLCFKLTLTQLILRETFPGSQEKPKTL